MARPAKNEDTTLAQGGTVVGSTFEDTKKTKSAAKTAATVVLAVSLPHGLKFDAVTVEQKRLYSPGLMTLFDLKGREFFLAEVTQ